jgi:hypothetical protein
MGAFGSIISEPIYLEVLKSIARNEEIKILMGGLPSHVLGREVISGSPYEMLAGKYHAELDVRAVYEVGRPGMPILGRDFATEYCTIGAHGVPGGYRKFDPYGVVNLPELQTDYTMFNKLVHCYITQGALATGYWSLFREGITNLEGNIVIGIAAHILNQAIFHPCFDANGIFDMQTNSNTSREALFATSVVSGAINRNTNILRCGFISTASGPYTHMILYEAAAAAIVNTVCGDTLVMGVRPLGGGSRDHLSELENKFAAEVVEAATLLKKEEANLMVESILQKYENMFPAPKGKTFPECYDLINKRTRAGWSAIYEEVWSELEQLGLKRPFRRSSG